MKIVHLCMQHYGGAGTSAVRLHQGLLDIGVDSHMLVLKKRGNDERIHLMPGDGPPVDAGNGELMAPGWLSAGRHWNKHRSDHPGCSPDLELFSDVGADTRLGDLELLREADVINLHWVAGMVDYQRDIDFLATKPLVWTMHDMNPFTGGCHYSVGCEAYANSCGQCPLLGSGDAEDVSNRYHRIKAEAYARLDMVAVTPSQWLGRCLGQSSLFEGREQLVVPYGVPTDVFKPYPRDIVRKELGLPESSRVVLFGAAGVHNRRKGFRFLLSALKDLATRDGYQDIILAVFGEFGADVPKLPFPIVPAGYVTEDTQLALMYSMADVYVQPSTQDNLPNVVLESLSCGTPVVGFDIGGMPDMVEHRVNGYLAPEGNVNDLSAGIRWALAASQREGDLRAKCRASALGPYHMQVQANAYQDIYQRMLSNHKA